MTENDWNGWKWLEIVAIGRSGWKWPKEAKHGWNDWQWLGIDGIAGNGWKWLEMTGVA